LKFIQPQQISSHIMTLMDEADEKLIIISPYYKFNKWHKLLETLKRLEAKNIDVQFYVREGENNSIDELQYFGVQPRLIHNLHAKLYMNEKTAIFSSMNLTQSSDINSLDIGYITETSEEYQELYNFYVRYIQNHKLSDHNSATEKFNFYDYLEDELIKQHSDYRVRSEDKGSFVRYQVGQRNFDIVFESQNGDEFLVAHSILSGTLYDFYKSKEAELQLAIGNELIIEAAKDGKYSMLICPFTLAPKYINQYSNVQLIQLTDKIKRMTNACFNIILEGGNKSLIRYL